MNDDRRALAAAIMLRHFEPSGEDCLQPRRHMTDTRDDFAGAITAGLAKTREPRKLIPGLWKGKVRAADDWDSDETNEEIAKLFYGE